MPLNHRILRIAMALLAISAIGIGAGIFLSGPGDVAEFFAGFLSAFVDVSSKPSGFSNANVDNEMRFYAVFWIAYGAILLHLTRASKLARARIALLLGIFFAGGIGRLLSRFDEGAPHLLFDILMVVELVIPILFGVLLVPTARPKA